MGEFVSEDEEAHNTFSGFVYGLKGQLMDAEGLSGKLEAEDNPHRAQGHHGLDRRVVCQREYRGAEGEAERGSGDRVANHKQALLWRRGKQGQRRDLRPVEGAPALIILYLPGVEFYLVHCINSLPIIYV